MLRYPWVWPFCRCNLAFKTLSSHCQSQIRCLLLQLIADSRSPSRTGSTERQVMLFATAMGSCVFKYKVVEEFWIQFRWAICFYKNTHLLLQVIIPILFRYCSPVRWLWAQQLSRMVSPWACFFSAGWPWAKPVASHRSRGQRWHCHVAQNCCASN